MDTPRDLFIQKGLELLAHGEHCTTLSLRTVAEHAGYSHNALYRHFPTRDSYLDALAAHGFTILYVQITQTKTARTTLRAYWTFAHEHPMLYELLFLLPKKKTHLLRKEAGMHTLALFIKKLGYDVAHPSDYRKGVAAWIALGSASSFV
jgi:AcrR family transcriptional regulator